MGRQKRTVQSIGSRFQALALDPESESDTENPASTEPSAANLCSLCQIFFYCRDPLKVANLHRIIDVINACRDGCAFCQVVWSALVVDYNQNYIQAAQRNDTAEHEQKGCYDTTAVPDWLLLTWDGVGDRQPGLVCEIRMIPSSAVPQFKKANHVRLPNNQVFGQVSSATSSRSTLDLAKAWLDYCDANHPLCRKSILMERRLPSRLLEIGRARILLREVHDLPLNLPPYITLSHCWGNHTHAMGSPTHGGATRKEPFDEWRCKGWNKSSLSLTFQHAIRVAERLGIKFLWIDSLCIKQDSEIDKARECARMWAIYSNAYCNIAATVSACSSEGLFRDHDTNGPQPCRISPKWDEFLTECASEGRGPEHHFINDLEFVRKIDNAPLCRRAWVVQERFLTPRNLHFASNQMWWECREISASETYPHGLPQVMNHGLRQKWDPLRVLLKQDVESCYIAWSWYVEEYSACALSHPEDKLVALAGIARVIAGALERCDAADIYLAGMWKRKLLAQLLWACSPIYEGAQPVGFFRAPTWSWASVDGAVSLRSVDDGETMHATLKDAYTDTSVNVYGAVSGGAITISGPLSRIVLTIPRRTGKPRYNEDGHCVPRCSARVPNASIKSFELELSLDHEGQAKLLEERSDLHAMLISDDYGLLLLPSRQTQGTCGITIGVFTRVGRFQGGKDYQEFMQSGPIIQDKELLYQAYDGNRLYTVEIV